MPDRDEAEIVVAPRYRDIIRDLKRIHGHVASIGYPILEGANVLRESRLMESKEVRARQERDALLTAPRTGR